MAAINQVGNALTGLTGTGAFVGANTPTLITPALGAATATSINFGGSTLSAYTAPTAFAPAFSFTTPGDLSVVYSNNNGHYVVIGNIIFVSMYITFTPTYTTASGDAIITNLPETAGSSYNSYPLGTAMVTAAGGFPANCTSACIVSQPSASYAFLEATGSVGGAAVNFTTTNFLSGQAGTIFASYFYYF